MALTPWQTYFAAMNEREEETDAMVRAAQAHAASKYDETEWNKWLKTHGVK